MTSQRSFRTLLSVLFLDNLGLVMVYPIFTPLLLKTYTNLLPPSLPLSVRLLFLAVLIAAFPFAQFLAGPFIGHIADSKGRKFAITLTLIGEGVGFFLSGISIFLLNFYLLLFSRFFTGFFAGNMTICLSSISDMHPNARGRSKNFGIVSSVVGVSFVIAIILGGTLSNETLNRFFNSSLPFWVMTGLALINLFLIRKFFTETFLPKLKNPCSPPIEVLNLFKNKGLRILYIVFFFFMLGWIVSLQFLSTFLIEHFTGTKLTITIIFVGVGFAWCLGNMVVNRILLKFYPVRKVLLTSLILSTSCLFVASEMPTFVLFAHFIIIGGLFASLAWTNCLAEISLKASQALQGKLLGLNQSMATISMVFAPLFGGMVGEFDIRTIYLFASASLLISLTILIIYYRNTASIS